LIFFCPQETGSILYSTCQHLCSHHTSWSPLKLSVCLLLLHGAGSHGRTPWLGTIFVYKRSHVIASCNSSSPFGALLDIYCVCLSSISFLVFDSSTPVFLVACVELTPTCQSETLGLCQTKQNSSETFASFIRLTQPLRRKLHVPQFTITWRQVH
jgi:hypothetical protein